MIVKYQSVPLAYVARLADNEEPLFVDFETHGLYGQIILAQFKQKSWDEAYVVEVPDRQLLKDFLINQWVVCYNIAYDMGTLGISPPKMDDLFFASKTAFPLQDSHSLDTTAPQFYEGRNKKELQKSFKECRSVDDYGDIHYSFTDDQLHYGALDVYALEWIWNRDHIQEVMLYNLAYKVDVKNQMYALDFEHNGMPVIAEKWSEAVTSTTIKRDSEQADLNSLVGFDLNVKSWQQKQRAFPELPINAEGKQPTDAKAFKKLYIETGDEKYRLVLDTTKHRTELQDLEKYRQSYIKGEEPVRIRTFFNVAGAITGRYTSKGGDRVGYTNIQNIGRHFKGIFGYPEGANRSIVSADYGTAELIAGCSIFNVPTMRDLIMDGIDLHKAMASEVTKKPVSEITKAERQSAKAVNFGYLFGMGVERFQDYAYSTFGVKLTMDESAEYKQIYYSAHPAIAKYHKQMARAIKRSGHIVETALGRRVHPDRYADALNIPVQGTIGETTKMAINFLMEDHPKLMQEVMIVNMVHDSIVVDAPNEYVDAVGVALVDSMKLAWREISKSQLFHYHDLPIGVDVDVNNYWS